MQTKLKKQRYVTMSLDIPENLQKLVAETTAKATGLVYTKPAQKQIELNGATYLISFIESLHKKDEETLKPKKQRVNPFENPEADLIVHRGSKYSIVLNKFPIIKNHFLLITNEFVKQDSLLQPEDLIVIHNILAQLGKLKRRNGTPVAFFNSGPHSGASQAHKHVQFISLLEEEGEEEFPLFLDEIVGNQPLFIPDQDHPALFDKNRKFAHFILPLNAETISEETFALVYMSLIQNCLTVLKDHHFLDHLKSPDSMSLSYNFIMTEKAIMLVPRSLELVHNEKLGYTFNLNSLGYLGMILVKEKAVFDETVNGNVDLDEVLLKGGFAREYEKGDPEGDY